MEDLSDRKSLTEKLKSISPIKLIVSSFFIIIVIGTMLLCLPFSSRDGNSTGFVNSLFIATSATCVTGLSVFDTWSHWSAFGQVVILFLIQVGGLGLVTFTTGFTLLFRRKLGLRDMQLAKEYTNGPVMHAPRLIRTIIFWTFACEFVGSIILTTRFIPKFGFYGVWVSIFTAVSAYCNAGFDIFGSVEPGISLCQYNGDFVVITIVSLLIILGGIGFLVVADIHSYFMKKINNKRSHPHLNIHSVIVITATLVLLVVGTIVFMILENNNTLKGMSFIEKLNASFFQSSSARTAGFFSVPIGSETDATKFFTIILMFIGASPASTGGGVKTTTFIVLIATVISILKGHSETIIMKHKVSKYTVYKSLSIVIIGLFLAFAAAMTIDSIESTKGIPVIDVFVETISAFATVGLSSGITPILSYASKLILCFAMFVGRVGPISLVLALTFKRASRSDTILPEGKIIVG